MTVPAETRSRRKADALVGAQLLLLAVHAALRPRRNWPRPPWLRAASSVAAVSGAAFATAGAMTLRSGLTASPLPNARVELRGAGPFAVVRHPIYAGLLLAVGARTVASGDRRQVLVLGGLSALLHYKASFEERALMARFADYPAYAARTPRLIPRLPGDRFTRSKSRRSASWPPR